MLFSDNNEGSITNFGFDSSINADSTLEEYNFFLSSDYYGNPLDRKFPLVLKEIDKNLNLEINITKNAQNITKKKRGKHVTSSKYEHTKNKNDNRVIKIQSHYFNFIIKFLNDIMKIFKIKYFFLPLDHKFKISIKIEHRKSLINKSIKDIVINIPISEKFSKNCKNHNELVYSKLKEEKQSIILDIMDKNYLFLFDKIYYKNIRHLNLNIFGFIDHEIQLSNKVNMYIDLINKNENNDLEYQRLMEKCVSLYFLSKDYNINC